MKIAVGFIIIIAVKTSINFWYLYRIKILEGEYAHFVQSLIDRNTQLRTTTIEYKTEIIEIFKRSGITHPSIQRTEPAGYGYISKKDVDVWDNMFVNDQEVIQVIYSSFIDARGVFKLRLRQTFNPLYWVELLIFLPGKMFNYLGFDANSLVSKILNASYWLLMGFYSVYNDQINEIIQSFLSKLIK